MTSRLKKISEKVIFYGVYGAYTPFFIYDKRIYESGKKADFMLADFHARLKSRVKIVYSNIPQKRV